MISETIENGFKSDVIGTRGTSFGSLTLMRHRFCLLELEEETTGYAWKVRGTPKIGLCLALIKHQ